MHKLKYKHGLLYTDLILEHEGKKIEIHDVIVDTGASHTIIQADYLAELDIELCDTDKIVRASGYGGKVGFSIRKPIDKISMGAIELNNIKLDFGQIDPDESINGLLGLDFLRQSKISIDLSNDTVLMYKNND